MIVIACSKEVVSREKRERKIALNKCSVSENEQMCVCARGYGKSPLKTGINSCVCVEVNLILAHETNVAQASVWLSRISWCRSATCIAVTLWLWQIMSINHKFMFDKGVAYLAIHDCV